MNYGKFQFWAFIVLTPIVFIRSPDKVIGLMIATFSLIMAGIAYQGYKELELQLVEDMGN